MSTMSNAPKRATTMPRKAAPPAPPAPGDHGRALMTYLDTVLDAAGIAPTTWARRHGITATNLRKWRDGQSDPGLITVEHIAKVLSRRPVELLIAAKYIDPTDVGITIFTPERRISIDDAIEQDPTLSEVERDILRNARQMGQAVRAGSRAAQSRKITSPPPPTN